MKDRRNWFVRINAEGTAEVYVRGNTDEECQKNAYELVKAIAKHSRLDLDDLETICEIYYQEEENELQ